MNVNCFLFAIKKGTYFTSDFEQLFFSFQLFFLFTLDFVFLEVEGEERWNDDWYSSPKWNMFGSYKQEREKNF